MSTNITTDSNSSQESSVRAEKDKEEDQVASSPASTSTASTKIDILLKPAGDAPIMKKKRWSVERTKRISWILEFIKKYIKMPSSESMFLYVNQAFAPSPDTEVGCVFDCFGSDGKLVLHYCKTQAWG